MKNDGTGSFLMDFFNHILCAVPEAAGRACEYVYFFYSVQSRLGTDCGGGAADSHERHGFACDFMAGILYGLHKAIAVRIVCSENPIIVYNGVGGSYELHGQREPVSQLNNFIFVRHCEVKTPDAGLAESADSFLKGVFFDVKT